MNAGWTFTRHFVVATVLAAGLVGLALFAAGLWAGSAWADARPTPRHDEQLVPDWFLPIADAYDRDPSVSPAFDFASLYDARPETYRPGSGAHEAR
jgi:hypothetical protein